MVMSYMQGVLFMKKSICYIFSMLIILCILYISMSEPIYKEIIKNDKIIKYVDSNVVSGTVNDLLECSIEQKDTYVVEEESLVFKEDLSASSNDVLVGNMSGYGPDCVGCSGYLAYGLYVGDGTIYYNDSQYGQVRIVAGDRNIEFGTIIKINDSMLAIVLDRGGAIGFGKKCLFDLLYASETEANKNGVLKNASFEILRYGFY